MKKLIGVALYVDLLLVLVSSANAQGKFAGEHRSLTGKTFTNEKNITGLKEFLFMEGTMLTGINDPKSIFTDLYKKGSTYVLLLTSLADTFSKVYKIEDVLEVKNVVDPWQIRSATCRQNKEENVMLIALVRTANMAYLKKVKQAWKIDLAKKHIESTPIKGIDCINEGFGE